MLKCLHSYFSTTTLGYVKKIVLNNKFLPHWWLIVTLVVAFVFLPPNFGEMVGTCEWYFSSGSSSRVGGGRETWNLCSRLRWPSFLWLIFTLRGGGGPWIRLDPLLIFCRSVSAFWVVSTLICDADNWSLTVIIKFVLTLCTRRQ